MDDPVLLVRIEPEDGGRLRALSPGVGWWWDHPHSGALVGPRSRVGSLDHLNRRFALLLPEAAAGIVSGSLPRDLRVAVEYGELLFQLSPVGVEPPDGLETEASRLGHPVVGLPPGTRAVVSPSDGTFYRRLSPEAPAFVEVGSRVQNGQPVGLVEVMKTFNQVLYGGPGFPEEAAVIEIRCRDAEEVRAGQVLVVVR